MFHDLDETLTKILDDSNAPTELKAADVSFVAPDKSFDFDKATVNLFLWDVHENRVLRDPVPIIDKIGNAYVRRTPPLRVDCSYMVTAWDTATGSTKAANEHRLLSQALQWLSRFPIIPPIYLQGSLVDPPFPHRTEVALPNGDRSMGEFWNALGQPPRPSFNLVVTIALDLERQIEGDLVTSKIIRYGQTEKPGTEEILITLGGLVLTNEASPKPIVEAWVRVDNLSPTKTDKFGRFKVDNLAAGIHSLYVIAVGWKPGQKTIVVPASPPEYEIKLDKI